MNHRRLGLSVALAALLLAPRTAPAHPLLELLPPELLADPEHRANICDHANRLVVAAVTNVVSHRADARQRSQGYTPIYSDVTLQVQRQVLVGAPWTSNITLRVPGGTVGTTRINVPHWPKFEVGDRWALALRYVPGAWTATNPLMLERVELWPDVALPTPAELAAAHQEYCQ